MRLREGRRERKVNTETWRKKRKRKRIRPREGRK